MTQDWVYDAANQGHGVLVIFTGGTIGSVPRDPDDRESPLIVVDWPEFRRRTSSLSPRLADGSPNPRYIGFNVDACSIQPLDSSDIGPQHWATLAAIVSEAHDRYEGFVILHGTDTMVHTASALSFMLGNLQRPVVLTGALIPHLYNPRNDALQNLLGALMIAHPLATGIPVVPEVTVYFDNRLLRGNRARKIHASGFDAFRSVNYPPLAIAGERIVVDRALVRAPAPGSTLAVRQQLEPRVASVLFFPGIQDSPLLEHTLGDPALRGVVLLTYGAGTVPSDRRVLGAIEAAVRRGVVAVAVTQCGGGEVELERYQAGVRLLEAGVVGGGDMTPEAALTKLMVLLGDPGLTPDRVAEQFQRDLAGELTTEGLVWPLISPAGCRLDQAQPCCELELQESDRPWPSAGDIQRAVLRLRGARIAATGGAELALRLAVLVGVTESDGSDRRPSGSEIQPPEWEVRRRRGHSEPQLELLDVTEACRRLAGRPAALALGLVASGDGTLAWESAELALYGRASGRRAVLDGDGDS